MMVLAMSDGAERMPPRASLGAEAALLARCRAQDPLAFRAFVVQHERLVFALLSRMQGPGASDLEDLAQETFLRAYRAFPGFDPEGAAKPSTWLLTIATRLALDAKKKRRVGTAPLGDEAEARASDSTPELRAERRQLGAALAEAMDALPDDQRAALLLSDVHGLSTAEIAEALDVPEATAKTRLFRARVKMREMLREEWRAS
jgi:RNA polymerase sigma-70 factor (ECF subfamily)